MLTRAHSLRRTLALSCIRAHERARERAHPREHAHTRMLALARPHTTNTATATAASTAAAAAAYTAAARVRTQARVCAHTDTRESGTHAHHGYWPTGANAAHHIAPASPPHTSRHA